MRLELPYPPSINHYWRNVRGRVVKSQEGREYMRKVAAAHRFAKPLDGPVALLVGVFRPRRIGDLDNTLKVLLDALKGVAYLDDSQVVRIEAQRFDDAKRPRAEVLVVGVPVASDPAPGRTNAGQPMASPPEPPDDGQRGFRPVSNVVRSRKERA